MPYLSLSIYCVGIKVGFIQLGPLFFPQLGFASNSGKGNVIEAVCIGSSISKLLFMTITKQFRKRNRCKQSKKFN